MRCDILSRILESGFTIQEFSEKSGIPMKEIKEITMSNSDIPMDDACYIAKNIGCSVDKLYDFMEQEPEYQKAYHWFAGVSGVVAERLNLGMAETRMMLDTNGISDYCKQRYQTMKDRSKESIADEIVGALNKLDLMDSKVKVNRRRAVGAVRELAQKIRASVDHGATVYLFDECAFGSAELYDRIDVAVISDKIAGDKEGEQSKVGVVEDIAKGICTIIKLVVYSYKQWDKDTELSSRVRNSGIEF